MAVFKPLIFSELSIVPVRVISSFVVNLLAKIGNIMDITKFSGKNPLYINKELRPYAVGFGIRTEPIVKGIAFKRPARLDQFTYT